MKYMIGIKCGMTKIFTNLGNLVPITVICVNDNEIVYVYKVNEKYFIQISYKDRINRKFNKSELGHFKKYNSNPNKILQSFIFINNKNINNYNKIVKIDYFLNFKKVNITGLSKGKGFSGVIKRWNFKSQDASHGNSLSHRAPGSIGQNQSPGRVFKGKKMAGHYGCKNVTVKNLKIFKIDKDKKLLFIKGSIPGCNGNSIKIKFVS